MQGDKYAGEWPVEQFLKFGIRYEQSAAPKSDLYRDLLPLLNSGQVELLDYPRLVAQLCQLERRTARSGNDSIDHAPGGHDDLCNAVAGVLVAILGRSVGLAMLSADDWQRVLSDVAAMPRRNPPTGMPPRSIGPMPPQTFPASWSRRGQQL